MWTLEKCSYLEFDFFPKTWLEADMEETAEVNWWEVWKGPGFLFY